MPPDVEAFLTHLDDLAGGAQPKFYRLAGPADPPPLTVIRYQDVPERGMSTGFSYGLSSLDKPEWKCGKPELMISVNSLDTAWPLAMGDVILHSRRQSAFGIGTIVHFGERIAEDSEMSDFFLFPSSLLSTADTIVLPERRVHLVQLYPIFHEEVELIQRFGCEAFFFGSNVDFLDVRRPRVDPCHVELAHRAPSADRPE